MHAKYVSTTGATIAQIIADFAALLSGSAISSLSASCDKPNSTLTSTVAPGWTIYDAAAAGSGQVMTAPDAGALTTKYVRIFAASASTIDLAVYDGWNATTHVGTNTSTASSRTLPYTSGSVNTYWLFSTARGFYIAAAGASNCGLGALEVTRDAVFLAGTTYPCAVSVAYDSLMASTIALYMARTKKMAATGDNTGSNAALQSGSLAARGTSTGASVMVGTARDTSEVAYYEVRPIWAVVSGDTGTSTNRPLVVGKLYDALEISGNAGSQFDTFSDGTDTYMLVYVQAGVNALAFKVA